ncbi:MAG: DNA recombination protein RmuC [Erysipelotrichales bacterium]
MEMILIGIIIILLLLIVIFLQLKNKPSTNLVDEIKNEMLMEQKDSLNNLNLVLANNNEKVLRELNTFKVDMVNSYAQTNLNSINGLNKYKEDVIKELNDSFIKVNDVLESKLHHINDSLTKQMEKNFLKSDTAYVEMIERLSKIDEAQKKIDNLSTNIVSLQDILSDKKARGAFGEVQLNNIIRSIFGPSEEYYKIQAKLSNGTIADALIKVPEPIGDIAIDSKFPLESYKAMVDGSSSDIQIKEATKQFKLDLKKHIDDISNKYIIPMETTNSAILFLPAEAIFAQIHAYHSDIIEYASSKRVWITSPTTLMATLTSIQALVQNIEQSKYAKIIHEHLIKLNDEFTRYATRWNDLSNHLDSVNKDAKNIHITTKKISDRFDEISMVAFEKKEDDLIEY